MTTKILWLVLLPWRWLHSEFPAVMALNALWGILILLFICWAIAALYALWFYCCRSSTRRSLAVGPPDIIISSAGRMGYHRRNSTPHQEEAPPIPGPPSCEELDQPPPCSCLFLEELDQPPPCSCLFPVTNASNMEPLTLQDNHMISSQQI